MEQNSTHIDELILSCLSGNADAKDTAELKNRLDASPDNKAHFRTMHAIWLASGVHGRAGRFDKNRAYEQFLARTARRRTMMAGRLLARRLTYAAAAVALLLIVAYTAFRQGGERVKNRFADIVIEAPLGAKTKTILPDGTLIWLNAGSRITYSQGFGVDDRQVRLTGEGYFEVTENAALPFQVNTEELQVSVPGTKFNFSNYPDNEEAIVSLMDGIVQVGNLKTGEKRRLSPDERALLTKKTGQLRIANYKTQHTAGWTNGYLFFDDELLPDIAKTLERSYNVIIRIADRSLETLRFYCDFSRREQTVEEALRLLESTGKLTYVRNGKEITLYAIRNRMIHL